MPDTAAAAGRAVCGFLQQGLRSGAAPLHRYSKQKGCTPLGWQKLYLGCDNLRILSLEASAVDIGVNVHPRIKEGVSEQRDQVMQGKIDHCLGKYSWQFLSGSLLLCVSLTSVQTACARPFRMWYFKVYRKLLGLVGLRKYFLRKFPALFCRSFDPYCALFLEVHGAHHSQEFLQSKLAIL